MEVSSCFFSLDGASAEEQEMLLTYAGRSTAPSRSDLSYYYGQLGQADLELLYALDFMKQLFLKDKKEEGTTPEPGVEETKEEEKSQSQLNF